MGKRSPSRDGSRSPKRRKDEGGSEEPPEKSGDRGRSRSPRSDSGRSRSRSPSSSSRSRSRSPSSSDRSRSRGERRRRSSPSSRSRSRSRGERRRAARSRSRSHSRSRSRGRGGGGRRAGRSPPRRGDRRPSPPRRGDRRRSPPRRGGENGAAADGPARPRGEGGAAEPPAAAAEPRERKAVAAGPAGGVYIPPFKLAQMMAEAADKESAQYQRMTWDALRKSINGLVNKVNAANIKHILPEVFSENLVRGRGLFCRSIMKSQMASPTFTPVYAALVAVVNTKFPELGELLLHRVVTQFKRSYKRNDKPVCTAAIKFIAHLANQQVVHEVLPLEVLLLLLETPSDDGVEVAVDFIKEVGPLLEDLAPQGLTTIMDRLRAIMSEGHVGKRTQYIIESLFSLRKAKWESKPAVDPELELVETEDQITHEVSLEEKLDPQMHLDVFKEDPQFKEHEEEYAAIRREILGDEESEEESESERERGEGESSSEEEESSEDDAEAAKQQEIHDETQTNLVNLRRTIYLTIMSALDFEEAGHKLLKMGIPAGQEMELATMIIECCSNEKTFIKYYALLGERFCKLKREYADCFSEAFVRQYQLIHRLETNKLRNTAKLFGHLLSTDAIPWAVLQVMRLTEEDTTSSSRIFIKILFQELAETLGLVLLNKRLNDPTCQDWFDGVFPKDSPRNMRFAINFFTSIGLGGLTDRMRDILKNLPKALAAQQAAAAAAQAGSSDSSSSSDSDSSSSSDSDSDSSSSSGSDSSSSSSGSSSSSDSDSDSSGSSSSSSSSESEDERTKRRRGGGGRRSPPPAAERRRGEEGARGAANGQPASAGTDRGGEGPRGEEREKGRVEEQRREERRERRDSRERQRARRSGSPTERLREAGGGGEERRGGSPRRGERDERRRGDRSGSRDRRRR